MQRALKDPIFIAIIAIGVVVSVGLAVQVRRSNDREAIRWLGERGELIALATEETVSATFADLRAVAAFMAASEQVTQDEFSRFISQMDMNPGVIGIGYLPIVDDSEIDSFLEEARRDVPGMELLRFDGSGGIAPDYSPRPTYYPLRYVHGGPFLDIVIAETPIDSQIDALGFDLGSEPLWFPAFEQALQSTEPTVSDLVGVGGAFEEQAFGAAHPILDSDGEIEGVLVGPGLEILLTADIGVSITSNVVWTVDNASTPAQPTDWPVWQRELNLPGSTWILAVAPTDEARRQLSSPDHWLFLASGLALTVALATTVRQTRLRGRERAKIDELRRAAQDKDRFLATVSHELRTPLTVVIGLAAELGGDNGEFPPAERAELLSMIEEHGQEAGAIVEDLLVAARSDIDKIAVKKEAVDPRAAVELSLAAASIESVPIIGECGAVLADPSRVQQILRNLLTNANRYGGPAVEIRLEQRDSTALITVADNGPPISPAHERAIFDPYVSAHQGGDQLGSIGLGLFISKKLAHLMGGNLHYRHDGSHVLFELSLPSLDAATTPHT